MSKLYKIKNKVKKTEDNISLNTKRFYIRLIIYLYILNKKINKINLYNHTKVYRKNYLEFLKQIKSIENFK